MNVITELRYAYLTLAEAGCETPQLDARLLMSEVLGRDEVFLIAHGEYELTAEQQNRFRKLAAERAAHKPIAYLINRREFMGLNFFVDERVLIPRPDTEILCEAALSDIRQAAGAIRLLDCCCGSGCIGLSILNYADNVTAVLSDISPEALAVAKINSEQLGLSERADLVCSDLLSDVAGSFDIIVSNPPYIESGEIDSLAPEISEYEPVIALDGGLSGLAVYTRLAAQAKGRLNHGGRIYLEIGSTQAEAVSGILASEGFSDIGVISDYAGLDRVVRARFGG